MRCTTSLLSVLLVPLIVSAAENDSLLLSARKRTLVDPVTRESTITEQELQWQPTETAIIICDMWDKHWCKCATQRVEEMAPRMNQIIKQARSRGVFVIHAPSDCMDFYKDTPQRKLAQSTAAAKNPPKDIDTWCRRLDREPDYPIDDSDGGCDDIPETKSYQAWKSQTPLIEIAREDAISASGREIFNMLEQRGIKNVMLMGVHTNMCVLGRPFGLRQMVKTGRNTVLVRDLTDAMYNPRRKPFVSHRRGTELVVQHIETHVCPTILADDIVGKPAAPHVVFVIGEDEYRTEKSLPAFAREELEKRGLRCTIVHADNKNPSFFPHLDVLSSADLLVLSVRRRTPSPAQLALIRDYLESGRPLVAIRTSSHAFDSKTPVSPEQAQWKTFDQEVLGGKYAGHYGRPKSGPAARLNFNTEQAKHPVLKGIDLEELPVTSHLYRNRDLSPSTQVLMTGESFDKKNVEPVAWTNTFKGGRVFYCSLGNEDDCKLPAFRALLVNAIFWGLERPLPSAKHSR